LEIKKDILWRIYLGFIATVILAATVIGRVIYIQRSPNSYGKNLSDTVYQRTTTLKADRGTIFSEDGQMLSTSLPRFDIYIDFKAQQGLREKNDSLFKKYVDSFSVQMADLFKDKTKEQYLAIFDQEYKKGSRHYLLKKQIPFEKYDSFRNFRFVALGRNKNGIIIEETGQRRLPFKWLANRTIGICSEYVDKKGNVQEVKRGLEASYDSVLSGRNGQRIVKYIKTIKTGPSMIPVGSFETESENGKDIYTTIDVNMQEITELALLKMLQQMQARYGTAIVMETQTGKIKAIANLGDVGNNEYEENNSYALMATEPGSTFKLVSLLAALDKGASKPLDFVLVGSEGKMQIAIQCDPVVDAERSPKPVLTIEEAIAHSSNVGLATIIYKAFGNNPQEFRDYITKYHMNKQSPLDLSYSHEPYFTSLGKDSGGVCNLIRMGFGYALRVSPLQTLMLYNAIANNGKMMKPYLVNSIKSQGTIVQQMNPQVMDEMICKESSLKAAKESLELAVAEGTGKPIFNNGKNMLPFKVAGKTGTAHVADKNIKYNDGVYQASFVGYFPADNPQYTCIVVIRTKAKSALHYGGQLAAPVFREIATKIYSMYVDRKTTKSYEGAQDSSAYFYSGNANEIKNVFDILNIHFIDSIQQSNWVNVYAENFTPVLKNNVVKSRLMPNVKGMGLRDAIRLLEPMGFRVQVKGSGKVVEQSIDAGQPFSKGQIVRLSLT
jgi:cell division protein FtsI (penicillin-binding protein 3)